MACSHFLRRLQEMTPERCAANHTTFNRADWFRESTTAVPLVSLSIRRVDCGQRPTSRKRSVQCYASCVSKKGLRAEQVMALLTNKSFGNRGDAAVRFANPVLDQRRVPAIQGG